MRLGLARAGLLGVAVGAGLATAVAVVPALATSQTVTLHNLSYNPNTLTVNVGDTVTYSYDGTDYLGQAPHNVHFDDGTKLSANSDGTPSTMGFTKSRTFAAAGTYRYSCDTHKNNGMTGTVVVLSAEGTTAPPPLLSSPKASGGRGSFVLSFRLSAATAVTGELRRRAPGGSRLASFGRISVAGHAGSNRLTLRRTAAGKRLARGAYTLRLSLPGGVPRTLHFTVT